MPELTPNLGLKKPLGNETVSRAAYNENLDILDQKAVKKGTGIAELLGGTLAERPDPEIPGRYYFAQDKGEIWLDTGTEWVLAAASNAELVAHLAETVQDEGGVHGLEYEEGTWTPEVIGSTEPGEGTYVSREGEYKRIGKIVYIWALVNIIAHTGSGTLYISGLPFIPENNYSMALGTVQNLTLGDNNVITGETYNGLPKIYFQTYPVGGGQIQLVQMDTSFQLKLSGFYFIN